MGGKSSSPPPAPDYTSAAQATAQGNLEATRAATAANRINQYTPYGNLTYTQTPSYTTDQNAYDTAYKQWQAGGSQGAAPDISQYKTYNPDSGWSQTINLSDIGQKLLDMQNNNSLGLGSLSNSALGNVQSTMGRPMDNSNVPGLINGIQGNPIQSQLNTRGVQPIPTVDENYRNQVQDALYRRESQYLDPQWSQAKESFDAQMANQGLVPGGEAYNNAYKNFQNSQQQAYDNAQQQAIIGGQNAMQSYFNMGLGANQAGMQNALTQGNFANQAQGQQFNQGLSNANLNNTTANQQLEQNAYLYNQPLNTLNALRTGAQVQNPTFSSVPQQQTTTGPNYLGAATQQYGDQLGLYNAQQAQQGSFMNGLMGLGGTLGSAYLMSDRRLKSNIVLIASDPRGFGIYDYDIFGHRVRGVMADEIQQVIPEAVITHGSGYLMVDYGRL